MNDLRAHWVKIIKDLISGKARISLRLHYLLKKETLVTNMLMSQHQFRHLVKNMIKIFPHHL